jgi:UDP-N-acetylglucosamine--N-acetylmuramyl-(pentapeptide) pyrophosphoryl-undecaprenol N-acetylglucosamine transferase
MRVIISAGGTGGHLYPAIATADALASLEKNIEILFITGATAQEREFVTGAGYTVKQLDAPGLRRKLSPELITAIYKAGRSLSKAVDLVKPFNADVTVGFGGSVTYPVLRAAATLGMPVVIQEQNMVPGLANKYLARTADIIAVSWDDAAPTFSGSRRVEVTGNPIRTKHLTMTREEARVALNLPLESFVVTVFGGSQGARRINLATVDAYKKIRAETGIFLLHLTGTRDYDETVKAWSREGASDRVKMLPYLDGMGQAYRASDLIVCRAGASTLAELATFGAPAVLIPYPYASGDHQNKNARIFRDAGAAVVINDEALNGNSLFSAIDGMKQNVSLLEDMSVAMLKLGRPDAARDLATLIVEVANRQRDKVE